MTMIEMLDPAGQIEKMADLQVTAVESLRGGRLAILDNTKPNFRRLATLVAEHLRDEFGLVGIAYFRKENPAVGASPELLNQIAESSNLVLTGSAD